MAHSLAVDRDLELSADYDRVERGSPAAGRKMAGKRLERHLIERVGEPAFSHPLGLPLLAAPLVWVLHRVAPAAPPDALLGLLGLGLTFGALLAGRELLDRLTGDRAESSLIAFGLYFGTPLWFYSRTFFTEPYLWALAVLALWLWSRERWLGGSILLGAAFWIKETAILIAVPLLLAVGLRRGVRTALRASSFVAAALALFALKNLWLYGAPLVTYYPFRLGDPVAGALGLLFDARHGLLPFAPLALAVIPWRRRQRGGEAGGRVEGWAWLVFLAGFALAAAWIDWRGGSCYGPRLLVPVLPALAVPLAAAWRRGRSSPAFRLFFFGLALAGFLVQWGAATDPFHAFWEGPWWEVALGRPAVAAAGLVLGLGALAALRARLPEPGPGTRS